MPTGLRYDLTANQSINLKKERSEDPNTKRPLVFMGIFHTSEPPQRCPILLVDGASHNELFWFYFIF